MTGLDEDRRLKVLMLFLGPKPWWCHVLFFRRVRDMRWVRCGNHSAEDVSPFSVCLQTCECVYDTLS